MFEGPGPEAAVHHKRFGRGGGGRQGRVYTLVDALLLGRCCRYDAQKILLPLVPLVAAIQHTLACRFVYHLQQPLVCYVRCGQAAEAPTPVATFMMCGLSSTITYTSLLALTLDKSTGAKPAHQ